jgi:hypothetical protein
MGLVCLSGPLVPVRNGKKKCDKDFIIGSFIKIHRHTPVFIEVGK